MRKQIQESAVGLLSVHFQVLYWEAWRSFIAPWFKCDGVIWHGGWCSDVRALFRADNVHTFEMLLLSLGLAHMYHTCSHIHNYMPIHNFIPTYLHVPRDICIPDTYACIPLQTYTPTQIHIYLYCTHTALKPYPGVSLESSSIYLFTTKELCKEPWALKCSALCSLKLFITLYN